MKIKCISCDALARPVYFCAAVSPHIIDIELIERGLHNTPGVLRQRLQDAIHSTDELDYDVVILVYGLCGQATAGLVAGKKPLVIPRAHDCITLFLGSRDRYQYQFDNFPGTYWYTHDYIERDNGRGGSLSLGSGSDSTGLDEEYQSYIEKYGVDNADYLMSIMGAWQKHYQRAVYIDMKVGDSSAVKAKAQDQATERGWSFEQITGDLVIIRKLLNGSWEQADDKDFLYIPPNHAIKMTFDDRIIGCVLREKINPDV